MRKINKSQRKSNEHDDKLLCQNEAKMHAEMFAVELKMDRDLQIVAMKATRMVLFFFLKQNEDHMID